MGQGGSDLCPYKRQNDPLMGRPSPVRNKFPYTEKGNQVVNQLTLKWANPGSLGGPGVITGPNPGRGEERQSQGAGLEQGGRSWGPRSQKRLGNKFSLGASRRNWPCDT